MSICHLNLYLRIHLAAFALCPDGTQPPTRIPRRKGRPTKPGQNLGSLNFCSSLVAGNADNISCVSAAAAAVGSCNCWLCLSLRPLFLAPWYFPLSSQSSTVLFLLLYEHTDRKWYIILWTLIRNWELGTGNTNNGIRSL